MINSGIYVILNLKTGKPYIGSTNNYKRRKKNHWSTLKSNKHHNYKLQDDVNHYGLSVFEFIPILPIIQTDQLEPIEKLFIKFYGLELLYNLTDEVSSPMRGKKHRPESIQKQREAKLGSKNPNFVYPHKHIQLI